MSRPSAAGLTALVATAAATPAAAALARRTGMVDHPVAHKVHGQATPVLGGLALAAGVAVAVAADRSVVGEGGPVPAALGLCGAGLLIGTLDDRIGLGVPTRLGAEAAAAALTVRAGLTGGSRGPVGTAAATLWLIAVMNATNLMDNSDGAAGACGLAGAAGLAMLAADAGADDVARAAAAWAGATAGFLPWNLRRPPALFLGDGGSLCLGAALGAFSVRLVAGGTGLRAVAATLPVALVLGDAVAVTIDRLRRGVSPLQGGQDHLAHRLGRRLGSPRRAASVLGSAQAVLSLAARQIAASSPPR